MASFVENSFKLNVGIQNRKEAFYKIILLLYEASILVVIRIQSFSFAFGITDQCQY